MANFITVNDLYQPMPTSLCLITTERVDGGAAMVAFVNAIMHMAGRWPRQPGLQDTLANAVRFSNLGRNRARFTFVTHHS